jgi:hypothetical protein
MSFQETIPALLIAPLGAIALVTAQLVWSGKANAFIWIYWLITVLVCYVSELLFVIPVLVLWPRLRQPPPLVGAAWGVLVIWCSMAAVAFLPGPPNPLPRTDFGWSNLLDLAYFSMFGLLSGLVYWFASSRSGTHLS